MLNGHKFFFPAVLLWGILLLGVPFPAQGDGGATSYDELIAEDLKRRLGAETVEVVLKDLSSREGVHSAKQMHCFVRGAALSGLRYDSITILVRSVSFRTVDQHVVLRHFEEGKVSGAILFEHLRAFLERAYPPFKITGITSKEKSMILKGVYVKRTTIPLKATVRFTGVWMPREDGTAILRFVDSSSDNPFVSTADIARALEERAPVLSVQSFFPSQKIKEIRMAGNALWFFTDQHGVGEAP